MSTSTGRQEAISAVINYKPLVDAVDLEGETSHALYGTNVFGAQEQKRRLSKDVYKALRRTIEKGEKLDLTIANEVAAAMKSWALRSAQLTLRMFFTR